MLCEYVERGVLTATEAIKFVKDIFFSTSNRLYGLSLFMKPVEASNSQRITTAHNDRHWFANYVQLKSFLSKHPSIRYLRLQWLDYTSTLRVRVLPIKQALKMFSCKRLVSVARAVLGLLQNDTLCSGFLPVLSYNLYPTFESIRLGSRACYATLQCEFREEDGSEVSICPRTVLRKQVERASDHNLNFLIGFEIEIVFMSSRIEDGRICYGSAPVNDGGHAWSSARALQQDSIMELLELIHEKLDNAGICLQQFHPESCAGQYEFIVDPLPPIEAIDTLLAAREIICSTAANAGMRATLYPKPLPTSAGTGAHLHISLTPVEHWESLYAGILKHLRAIAAFTYSNDASYERVVDGKWAGGTWIAWGTQNRETPLRRVDRSHFEIKCIDGLSNPYLVLAVLIGTGLGGVLDKEPMTLKDCTADPSALTSEQREDLGITQQFPKSIDQALTCLEKDEELCTVLGKNVVDTYLNVKRAEHEMLKSMTPEDRRHWLIERY